MAPRRTSPLSRWIAVGVLLAAIGGLLAFLVPWRRVRGVASPPTVAVATPSALPEDVGDCGGLGDLAGATETRLLRDRVRITLPPVTLEADRPGDPDEVVSVANGDARLWLGVAERRATSGGDLERRVTAIAEDEVVERLGEHAVALFPRAPETREGLVGVARSFVETTDGTLLELTVRVTEDAMRRGGCIAVARALLASARSGDRGLLAPGGERRLPDGVVVSLPPGTWGGWWQSWEYSGADFWRVAPLGSVESRLSFGTYMTLASPGERVAIRGSFLGESVTWIEERSPDRIVGSAETDHWHLSYEAADVAEAGELRALAASFRRGEVRRDRASLDGCGADALLPEVDTVAIDDVALLRNATSLRITARSSDEGAAAIDAFRRIAASENARTAFLDLAVHGTTAGRLYGLAGLYDLDPTAAREIWCAVVNALEPEVVVVDPCGERREPARDWVARDGGARGEPSWSRWEWRTELLRPLDVIGGGLGRVLALEDPFDDLDTLTAALDPHGLSAIEPTAVVPERHDGPPASPPRIWDAAPGGLCVERVDGRLACWPAASGPRVRLVTDAVRHPLDYAGGPTECLLDATGARVCATEWTEERALVRGRCGIDLGTGPHVERYADGPWRSLGRLFHSSCGIRRDGTVHCFGPFWRPSWAEYDGVTDSWPVPVPERVAGMDRRTPFEAVLWTTRGEVFRAEQTVAPISLGRVAGLRRLIAGYRGPMYAELENGHVLAYGRRTGSDAVLDPWSRTGGVPDGAWVEVPELRGAHVVAEAEHACASFDDGRVTCWGAVVDDPAADDVVVVPELAGLRELHVAHGVTCGRLDERTLRCVGRLAAVLPDPPSLGDARTTADVLLPVE